MSFSLSLLFILDAEVGFIIDAEAGCQQLLLRTEDLSVSEYRQWAIDVFASVFGDRRSG